MIQISKKLKVMYIDGGMKLEEQTGYPVFQVKLMATNRDDGKTGSEIPKADQMEERSVHHPR